MSTLEDALRRLMAGGDLSRGEARAAMLAIMNGEGTPAVIGAYLASLRTKGESVDEIAGSADAMRTVVLPVVAPSGDVVDTCGTGGDGLHTINVSTGAAIIAAAAGCVVAKHGNRAVSSSTGSADVLEALGVRLDATPETLSRSLADVGVAFLFAPALHPAMKHAMPVRRELGVRTIFNLLGPLTNPAGANRQLVGVYDRRLVPIVAVVLGELGARRALVVHGDDGMDEITTTTTTQIAEWRDGHVTETVFDPAELGITPAHADDIRGGDAGENAIRLEAVLRGRDVSSAAELIWVNAGAMLYVAEKAPSIGDGFALARETTRDGRAWEALVRLREASRGNEDRS